MGGRGRGRGRGGGGGGGGSGSGGGVVVVVQSDQAGEFEGLLQVEEVARDFPGVPQEKVLQGEGDCGRHTLRNLQIPGSYMVLHPTLLHVEQSVYLRV